MMAENDFRRTQMGDKLRLKAADCEDLAVLAACLQDARVPLKEMAFLPGERRFMAAFTRYRREVLADPAGCEGITECASALVFDEVDEVKYRGIDPADLDREFSLLTVATAPGRERLIHVDLVFEATPASSSASTGSPPVWTTSVSRCSRR
jgi:hypothetical protein